VLKAVLAASGPLILLRKGSGPAGTPRKFWSFRACLVEDLPPGTSFTKFAKNLQKFAKLCKTLLKNAKLRACAAMRYRAEPGPRSRSGRASSTRRGSAPTRRRTSATSRTGSTSPSLRSLRAFRYQTQTYFMIDLKLFECPQLKMMIVLHGHLLRLSAFLSLSVHAKNLIDQTFSKLFNIGYKFKNVSERIQNSNGFQPDLR